MSSITTIALVHGIRHPRGGTTVDHLQCPRDGQLADHRGLGLTIRTEISETFIPWSNVKNTNTVKLSLAPPDGWSAPPATVAEAIDRVAETVVETSGPIGHVTVAPNPPRREKRRKR